MTLTRAEVEAIRLMAEEVIALCEWFAKQTAALIDDKDATIREFTEERDAWELKNAKNVKLYEDERDRLREALREVLSEMSRRRLTSAERIARAALEAEK